MTEPYTRRRQILDALVDDLRHAFHGWPTMSQVKVDELMRELRELSEIERAGAARLRAVNYLSRELADQPTPKVDWDAVYARIEEE